MGLGKQLRRRLGEAQKEAWGGSEGGLGGGSGSSEGDLRLEGGDLEAQTGAWEAWKKEARRLRKNQKEAWGGSEGGGEAQKEA